MLYAFVCLMHAVSTSNSLLEWSGGCCGKVWAVGHF